MGERRSFKAVSPGLLPPLGIIFAHMVHPNYLGFQFFASVDSATGTVSFSESKRRDKNTLEAISTPLMLIVLAKECFEQFDEFIKQVTDLQHSREPVDGRPSEDDSSGKAG